MPCPPVPDMPAMPCEELLERRALERVLGLFRLVCHALHGTRLPAGNPVPPPRSGRDQGEPTHSSDPSLNRWCFQIGTSALSVSMSSRDASNDVPRCAEVVATTTATSPMSREPTRWTRGDPVHVVGRGDPLAHLAQPVEGRGMGGVVEPEHALAVVVVAHPADEEREAARGLVVEGGDHLVDLQLGLAQVHQPQCRMARPRWRGLRHAGEASPYPRKRGDPALAGAAGRRHARGDGLGRLGGPRGPGRGRPRRGRTPPRRRPRAGAAAAPGPAAAAPGPLHRGGRAPYAAHRRAPGGRAARADQQRRAG